MDMNGMTKWLNYLCFKDKGLLQQAHHSIKVFFLLSNPGSTQPIVCYLSDMWARRTVQIKFGCDYLWVTFTLKTNKMIKNWYVCFSWNKQLHLTAIRRSQSITKWSYFAIDISRSAIKTFPRYNLIPQLLLHKGQCLSRALYFLWSSTCNNVDWTIFFWLGAQIVDVYMLGRVWRIDGILSILVTVRNEWFTS